MQKKNRNQKVRKIRRLKQEAQYLAHHTSLRLELTNAEPLEKRHMASVFTQEIMNRIDFPHTEGEEGFVFVLFFNGALRHQLLFLGLYLLFTKC